MRTVSFTLPWAANDVGICFHVFICLFSSSSFSFIFALSLVLRRQLFSPLAHTRAEWISQGFSIVSEGRSFWLLLEVFPYINSFQTCLCPHTTSMYTKVYIPSRPSSCIILQLFFHVQFEAQSISAYDCNQFIQLFYLLTCLIASWPKPCQDVYTSISLQYYLGLNYKHQKKMLQNLKGIKVNNISDRG